MYIIFTQYFIGTISLAMALFQIVLAAYFVHNDTITIGELAAFLQLSNYIASPIQVLPNYFILINSIKKNINEIDDFLNTKTNYDDHLDFNFKNSISIENLFYAYGDKPVLKNINLKIEKNKKYEIVGESGSGKSTLAKSF